MALQRAISFNLNDEQQSQEAKRLMYKLMLCLPYEKNFTIDKLIGDCDNLSDKERGTANLLSIKIQNLLCLGGYIRYFEPDTTYQLFAAEKSKKLKVDNLFKHIILQTLTINDYQGLDLITQYIKLERSKTLTLLSDLKDQKELYIKKTPTYEGTAYVINIETSGIAAYEREKYLQDIKI